MSILCYTSFSLDPINNPDRENSLNLNAVQGQTYTLKAVALDSEDLTASFTYQWSVLNTRTGQTANLADAGTETPILQDINETWGNIRVFCVATNINTLETSEANPLLAPDESFCTLKLLSANKTLDLPALASRNWYDSLDTLFTAVENIDISTGLSSATINQAGDLILTLSDGSSINAGHVVGNDGVDGISVTNANINGLNELVFTFSDSTTVNVGVVVGNDGVDGVDGADGVSVTNANINSSGDLIITLSDSSTINAGQATSSSEEWVLFTLDKDSWVDANGTVNHGFDITKQELIAGAFYAHVDMKIRSTTAMIKDMGAVGNQCNFFIGLVDPAQWIGNALNPVHYFSTQVSASSPERGVAISTGLNIPIVAGTFFLLGMSANQNGIVHGLSATITCEVT